MCCCNYMCRCKPIYSRSPEERVYLMLGICDVKTKEKTIKKIQNDPLTHALFKILVEQERKLMFHW